MSSFGIETRNRLIHSRSSLENHTRFLTKMGKVYTRFQTKTLYLTLYLDQNSLGRHIPIRLVQGSTPPVHNTLLVGTLSEPWPVEGPMKDSTLVC